MPLLTHYTKASLGLLAVLVAYPRDGATYCHKKVVEPQQGKALVLGSEEVGSPSQEGSINSESQSTVGYHILKCKNKRLLTCPKLGINTNSLSNVNQKNL